MIPETSTGIVTGKRSLGHKGECLYCTAVSSALNNLPSLERNSKLPTRI